MSTVTLTLESVRHAPWGLLSDEEHPRMLVWLTEENPIGQIDSIILTDWDVVRIQQSYNAGIINVEGLDGFNLSPPQEEEKTSHIPIVTPPMSKVASHKTILDVTALMRREAERGKALENRIKGRYPKIDELLAMPAHRLKKELKELAKGHAMVSFFRECRGKEEEGKNRKTVIALLVEIIKAKMAAIDIDNTTNAYSGQTTLSDAYYDMIEEFEDEEEDEEVLQ